jgi:hypothetical protein
MKAIISHDIDHISVWEHLFKDTIIPKHIARMHIELVKGKISMREYLLRWSDFYKNKWQNIDELITFNNIHGLPSSFFMAVNKGVGLNYSNEAALLWIQQIQKRNCELSIHGIEFDNFNAMQGENNLFQSLSKQNKFGIRMHYVRNSNDTFLMLDKLNYTFDSTQQSFLNPFKIGKMWEFPIQIMDGWVIENKKPWQSLNLNEAKDATVRLIDKSYEYNLNYLNIDFHDRYFSYAYETWLNWYIWLVEYLKKNEIGFINFEMAIKELEGNEKNIPSYT